MVEHAYARQTLERTAISTHDGAPGGDCAGGDDQVVHTAPPTGSADGGEQARVMESHGIVVRQDRDGGDDVVDVRLAAWPLPGRRQMDPDGELGECDRRDRDVVVIADQLIDGDITPFGIDQERRVEEKQAH